MLAKHDQQQYLTLRVTPQTFGNAKARLAAGKPMFNALR